MLWCLSGHAPTVVGACPLDKRAVFAVSVRSAREPLLGHPPPAARRTAAAARPCEAGDRTTLTDRLDRRMHAVDEDPCQGCAPAPGRREQ
uniref:Uncharacterized protein n=1 Tax=Nonomuraea gerenzanensis TaxID=93944 RepID=A0A1M4DVS0_9ACTN|nr:hypothetical protein BN4615_P176 [Nonomuraea gerenzanensis]